MEVTMIKSCNGSLKVIMGSLMTLSVYVRKGEFELALDKKWTLPM